MLKAIIFDIGNVLVPFDFKRAYERLEPLCGLSTEEIRARLRAAGIVPRFETGRMDEQCFVREFSKALGFEFSFREFCDLWSCIFLADPLISERLLESLSRRYRMVLLSNTNPIHMAMLRANYPLFRYFHHAVLSHEVGAAKPAPRIYEEAIRQAGCQPRECFYTDDIEMYVDAARQLGIQAVQFQSAGQIEKELQARGAL